MIFWRKLSILPTILLLAVLLFANAVRADITDEARQFIDTKGNEAIQTFGVKDRDERYAKFRKLLTDSFAIKGIARFVIGRFWKKANPRQQQHYLKLFKDYLIANYAAKSWIIKDVKLRVVKVTKNKKNDISIDTMIHIPHKGNKDVPLGFRVRKGKHGMKIVDLKIEGVSLIISHRSEFTAVMGKYNGDLGKFNDFLAKRTARLEKTARLVDEALKKKQLEQTKLK